MATVKVKWRPSSIEGKAGRIYYQVIHNRTVRQLRTDLRVFRDEWDEARSMVIHDTTACRRDLLSGIQKCIDGDINRLNSIIDELEHGNKPYSVTDITSTFRSDPHSMSFFRFMSDVIEKLKQLNRYRTADNYVSAFKSFKKFLGDKELYLDEIDSDTIMMYEACIMERGVMKNTVSFYMRILRAVYNRAVEQGLMVSTNPFKHVYTGVDKTTKRAISIATVKRIKMLDLEQMPTLDFARDMFMFSFYTRGMSFVDMSYLRKTDLRNGLLTYRRRKTGQQLSIKWERCMRDIVKKYECVNVRRHTPSDSPYLLPILKQPYDTHRTQYRNTLQQINKYLKTVARLAGINMPLTLYVARHSWASIARMKKIPLAVISEGMGHDSESTTQIYLASLDTSVIDRANRLIIKDL